MKIVAEPFTISAMAENRRDGGTAALTNISAFVAIFVMAYTLPFPPHVFVCVCAVLFGSGNCGLSFGISLYSI